MGAVDPERAARFAADPERHTEDRREAEDKARAQLASAVKAYDEVARPTLREQGEAMHEGAEDLTMALGLLTAMCDDDENGLPLNRAEMQRAIRLIAEGRSVLQTVPSELRRAGVLPDVEYDAGEAVTAAAVAPAN